MSSSASEPGRPLDGATLLAIVREVAEELPPGDPQRSVVAVGGAVMAWKGLRDATKDIDSARELDHVLSDAVRRVATRHGLSPRWMNDAAASYLPQGFWVDEEDLALDHPRLRVINAPADQVLLMKVFAGRATDTDDIRRLWPHTSFRSGSEAADAFHRAYPHEEHDPELGTWIDAVVSGDVNG